MLGRCEENPADRMPTTKINSAQSPNIGRSMGIISEMLFIFSPCSCSVDVAVNMTDALRTNIIVALTKASRR